MNSDRITFDISSPGEEVLSRTSSVLLSGGVVLYPSDTVYGLLCRADDRGVVDRIRHLKGCGTERPFILVVSGPGMARELTDGISEVALGIMTSYWPGPVTVVLPAGPECPGWVAALDGSVALRQPGDPLSSGLLLRTGLPLVSTSANISGQSGTTDLESIPGTVTENVDLILDGGLLPGSEPSAVIRPADGGVEVIRPGHGWLS